MEIIIDAHEVVRNNIERKFEKIKEDLVKIKKRII